MKQGFSTYDTVEYLKTEDDIRLYWEAVQEEAKDCPELLIAALNDIARARNMQQLAEQVGMSRQGLYKALSPDGNPSFVNVMSIIHALGLDAPYQHPR
jgi:probable addiction module antidote protein